jgi:hypothetical protein
MGCMLLHNAIKCQLCILAVLVLLLRRVDVGSSLSWPVKWP